MPMLDDAAPERGGYVESGPFEMVPHWMILDGKISGNAIKLYVVLRKFGNQDRPSWPARTTLAKLMDVSVSTVDRLRRELVEAGALCHLNRKSDSGDWTSNLYHVHWERCDDCRYLSDVDEESAGVSPPAGDVSPNMTRPVPPNMTVRVPPNMTTEIDLLETDLTEPDLVKVPASLSAAERPPNAVPASQAFDAFWSAYPRRQGKGAAKSAWKRATKKARPDRIIAAAARYRDDPNREDDFTALPSTWLNQERWDDDPLPPRRGTLTRNEERKRELAGHLQQMAEMDARAARLEVTA